MRLELPDISVEKSADFEAEAFDFGNKPLIMEILRGKMYSNPISTVCQEYMSNARDAHREAGCADRPIEVILPNKLSPNFSVRDFGPGITPDRMSNVFILYGNSTKRSDDKETGGFGLGCKCAFSYVDSFIICSITKETVMVDGKPHEVLIKRTYVALIDKSRLGQMNLVDTCVADENEERGTTITVGVKPGDYNKFSEHVSRVSSFWDIRPKVIGNDRFAFSDIAIDYENIDRDWAVLEKPDYYSKVSKTCRAILDGIPYDLNLSSIYPAEDGEEYEDEAEREQVTIPKWAHGLFAIPLRLYFKTGQLQVTANRESIDYQPEAVEVLQSALEAVYDELNEGIGESLVEANSLWEANIIWRTIKPNFEFLKENATWQGLSLKTKIELPKNTWNHDVDTKLTCFKYHIDGDDRYSRQKPDRYNPHAFTIPCNKDVLIVENDTESKIIPKTKMYTIMDENPNISTVYVVKVQDQDHRKKLEKTYNWSSLGIILLSTVKKTFKKQIRGKSVISKAKIWQHGDWKAADVDLINDEAVYVVRYKNRLYSDGPAFIAAEKTGHTVDDYDVRKVVAEIDVPIYAVLARYVKKLGPGWKTFKQQGEEMVAELEDDEDVKAYGHYNGYNRMDNRFSTVFSWIEEASFLDLVEDKVGVFHRYADLSKKVAVAAEKVQTINTWRASLNMGSFPSADETLKTMSKDFLESYPLLIHIRNDWHRSPRRAKESATTRAYFRELSFYVNTKDAQNSAKVNYEVQKLNQDCPFGDGDLPGSPSGTGASRESDVSEDLLVAVCEAVREDSSGV